MTNGNIILCGKDVKHRMTSATKNATKKNRNETLQNNKDFGSCAAISRLLNSLRTAGRMERRPQRDGHKVAAGVQLLG